MSETQGVQALGLAEYAHIQYLPLTAQFELSPGGLLKLKVGETEYPRVTLHRVFPFTLEDRYISVLDIDSKEVGLIDRLSEFPPETIALLKSQMALRYYAPVIRGINSVKEDFGYLLWDVETDVGTIRFTSLTSYSVIMEVAPRRYLITDLDGNRFEIPDIARLTAKDVYKIEMFL